MRYRPHRQVTLSCRNRCAVLLLFFRRLSLRGTIAKSTRGSCATGSLSGNPDGKNNPQVLTNERPHDTRSAVRSRPTSRTQQTSSFSVKLRHDRTITVTTNTIIRAVSLIRCVTYRVCWGLQAYLPQLPTPKSSGVLSLSFFGLWMWGI